MIDELDQINVIAPNSTTSGSAQIYDVAFTLPTPFNSTWNRHVALAGFDMSNTIYIIFSTEIRATGGTDTTGVVDVIRTSASPIFYKLSLMIVLVKASNYIWVIDEGKFKCSQL